MYTLKINNENQRFRVQSLQRSELKWGQQHSKSNKVAPATRIEPVAVSTPHAPARIVERPATKNPGFIP